MHNTRGIVNLGKLSIERMQMDCNVQCKWTLMEQFSYTALKII